MIRLARADDLPRLAAVEDAAEALFADTAMAWVIGRPKGPVASRIPDGVLIWVSVDADDVAMGFLEAEVRGDWLHILELSVHPDGQRQGRARALLATAIAHARCAGLARVSLTTDRDIPFNGPIYARQGFAEVPPARQPQWLADLLTAEAAAGFDPLRRVAMARRP